MADIARRLSGGNMNTVVRIGDTVRRPSGPWTPTVHALLRHLRVAGFRGAPEPLGIDEQGREVLRYVEGRTAWPPPDGWALIANDSAMRAVAEQIAAYHAAVESLSVSDAVWSDLVQLEPQELVCHHDLAPWNLVVGQDLVFVDWDLAAPGPRLADLGYAARAFAPMFPGYDGAEVLRRLSIMCDVWCTSPAELVYAALERATGAQRDFERRARRGQQPWTRMWNQGHGAGNQTILQFMEANAGSWVEDLEGTTP